MIHEQELKSWDEFDRIVKKRNYRQWIYRGHTSNDWGLESSLYRAFQDAGEIIENGNKTKTIVKKKHENVMIEHFKSNAHLFLSHLPEANDALSWLALMQHYGAPTRLLDFSFSPYIAAYFALEANTEDSAIYCINHKAFERLDRGMGADKLKAIYRDILHNTNALGRALLYAFEPKFTSQRLMAQQGVFLAPNTLEWSHEQILKNYNLNQTEIYRWVIPKQLRYEGIRMLKQRNVMSSILYPGIEGYCKSFVHQPVLDARLQRIVG